MNTTPWQNSHQIQRTILDNLIEHVVYHDMAMRVLWANRAACQSAGLELDQVIGRHCYEIWPKRATPCENCPVSRSWKTRLPQSKETTTPDGRSWYISASPVFDDRGQIVAMIELTLEVTERVQATEALKRIQNELGQLVKDRTRELVRLNEQLRQEIEERKETEAALLEQKNCIQQLAMELSSAEDRERQRLAGVLHDELQQMLAYLKIQLTTQLPHVDGGERLDALTSLVDDCIDHCRNLSHEMNPPILKKKNFQSALQWLCRQMKERYGLGVDLQMAADIGITSSVLSSMLIRSIRELLFNVVKHSGGASASIACSVDKEQLRITVKDDGKGCLPEDLKAKQTTEGVFGLFNIEDRIKVLGGRVRIRSAPGGGFCVTLCIPRNISLPPDRMQALPNQRLTIEAKPGAPAAAAARAVQEPATSVLIVDDHELMRAGLATLLQKQTGIAVVGMAADGREAVERALELKPDVILMDISMPVMDGIQAADRIRELLPATRIIGLTIHKDPETLQAMLDAGACVCLSKTGSPDELIKRIRM